jgi:hypothetical protein
MLVETCFLDLTVFGDEGEYGILALCFLKASAGRECPHCLPTILLWTDAEDGME